jgi:hypothetical protein
MNDFWADVEFPPEKLDRLYHDFDMLEKNIDEIIKVVPLPKKIWGWESYYPWFVSIYEGWIDDFKKNFQKFENNKFRIT